MEMKNLVLNHQAIFLPINFGLSWIEDSEMRNLMKNYYLTLELTWPDEELMVVKLQNKANLIRDYYNNVYELTKFKYNPIENYDRYEDIESNARTSSNSTAHGEGNHYEFPMQLVTKKPVANDISTSTGAGSAEGSETRKAHIHGNIGVTTNQLMLESEIELQKQLSKLNEVYIKEFNDLFMITI